MLSKIGYDHRYLRWNPRNGRHLVWHHGAQFWIFRDSQFVAANILIIHAKFDDSSFNRLGAMALGPFRLSPRRENMRFLCYGHKKIRIL